MFGGPAHAGKGVQAAGVADERHAGADDLGKGGGPGGAGDLPAEYIYKQRVKADVEDTAGHHADHGEGRTALTSQQLVLDQLRRRKRGRKQDPEGIVHGVLLRLRRDTEQFDEVGCCRLFPFDNGALSNMPYDYVWGQMTEGENSHLAQGYLQKADTLEELAEKLNIPADAFVETVKRYNELCAKGVDEDYGKSSHRMTPVDTAPFYGIRTCAWHLTTLDGCRINTDMQVIREDGTPIEGLYATGDCTGGFFANNYPNLFTGLACGRTMTFGRHAAKVVAKK